jgi:mannose-1-phosphate guanylyltransferase
MWSDIGSWDEYYRLSMKDAKTKMLWKVMSLPLTQRVVWLMHLKKLIALVDVQDIAVVDSGEALLICKRGSTNRVKELVDYLRRKQITKYL